MSERLSIHMTLDEKFEKAKSIEPAWNRVTLFSWGDLTGMRDKIAALTAENARLQQQLSVMVPLTQYDKDLAEQMRKVAEARAANELDRRSLWAVVRAIDEEITGRMWLIEGRGPYEWDDDRYRQEFGWAIHALQEKLEPLRKISHDLKNCPDTEQGVNSVRRLEQRLAEAERTIERITNADDVMKRRIETLLGVTCKRCERGDKLYVEPSTGFYTHTLGGNYCDAHELHSLLNTPQSIAARAALSAEAQKEGGQ